MLSKHFSSTKHKIKGTCLKLNGKYFINTIEFPHSMMSQEISVTINCVKQIFHHPTERKKTWQIAIDRIVCKYLSSANNDESISLQSGTANSVSCKWHEDRPNSRKWIREGWLLWSPTAGSASHAGSATQAADKQGKFGVWKGKNDECYKKYVSVVKNHEYLWITGSED